MERKKLYEMMEARRLDIVDWDGRIDDLIDTIDMVAEDNGQTPITDKTALKIEVQLLIEAWMEVEAAERAEITGEED